MSVKIAGLMTLKIDTHAMFAVVTCNRDELVEDPALVRSGRRLVTISYCCYQLLFRHPAHASHHAIASEFSVSF